jgi:hypothetical protein
MPRSYNGAAAEPIVQNTDALFEPRQATLDVAQALGAAVRP